MRASFKSKWNLSKLFDLNLWKLSNYVQNFGSNIVEGVAESWVEAEMSWLKVGGAGWRWVHGLVIPVFLVIFVLHLKDSEFAIGFAL